MQSIALSRYGHKKKRLPLVKILEGWPSNTIVRFGRIKDEKEKRCNDLRKNTDDVEVNISNLESALLATTPQERP